MSPALIVLAVAALAAGGYSAYRWLSDRWSVSTRRDESDRHATELGRADAVAQDALAQVARLTNELAQATVRANNEERRRVEVVEMIAVMERERNQWREMYWECGTSHSAAQEQLFAEIQRLTRILVVNKITVKDKTSDFMRSVAAFSKKHGPAARPSEGGLSPGYTGAKEAAPGREK